MKTILLIDDEDDFRTVLAQRLQHEGYTVAETATGDDALVYLEKTIPALIVLDIMMPLMSGYQVWTRLKQDARWKNIPVIIVSARHKAHDRFFGPIIPDEDYMMKATSFEKMLAHIVKKTGGV